MSDAVPPPVDLDHTPKKNHIWAAAEVHADQLDIPEHRPSHPDRTLWYVPTISIWDAHRIDQLLTDYDIESVYDLGAGDFRLSLWLDRRGYDVTAYELNHHLVESIRDRFHLGNLEIRQRDYYEDYHHLTGPDAAVIAFGGTNELPEIPDRGLAIQGYGETGVRAYYDGEVVGLW